VLATTAAIGGAEFAGTALLGAGGDIDIQTGSGATDTTTFTVTSTTTTTLGINALDVTAAGGPATDIAAIDSAIAAVNSQRSQLGADQAAFESAIRNAMNVSENTSAARSRILDTDYAAETANLTKNQILQQASTSILAQANQQPQSVLALLQ
jgi:flagellin